MGARSQASPIIKVYRLHLLWRILSVPVLAGLAVFGGAQKALLGMPVLPVITRIVETKEIVLVFPVENYPLVISYTLLSLTGFLLIVHGVTYPHIRIAADGIEYLQVGYRIQATWDKIEQTSKSQGLLPMEALVLDKPRISGLYWLAKLAGEERMIPVGKFSSRWRESSLGQTLQAYAPHAFNP